MPGAIDAFEKPFENPVLAVSGNPGGAAFNGNSAAGGGGGAFGGGNSPWAGGALTGGNSMPTFAKKPWLLLLGIIDSGMVMPAWPIGDPGGVAPGIPGSVIGTPANGPAGMPRPRFGNAGIPGFGRTVWPPPGTAVLPDAGVMPIIPPGMPAGICKPGMLMPAIPIPGIGMALPNPPGSCMAPGIGAPGTPAASAAIGMPVASPLLAIIFNAAALCKICEEAWIAAATLGCALRIAFATSP
mmetsp:Transcript_42166/g.66846  ORF Transcript_42166/g.66846 Transcript_42166/m.66846 type:complete len:241 (+) Transcript_42166:1278-2000(+)